LKIVVLIRFLLPSGGIQVLPEISLLVEQPHGHQRHSQVAGRFQMVAGQHSQAAREDGKTLGEPEFRRKVGYPQTFHLAVSPAVPRGLGSQIGFQFARGPVQVRQE
jgi:hypothetical protein